jgi:hypothetical protein
VSGASGDIAIVTSSGRAYYKLVTELKKRELAFFSLTPHDVIPTTVKVVVTTERDQPAVDHPQVLVYAVDEDPAPVIDQAIQRLKGKDGYGHLVFGVDPGKRVGVAVLDDGAVVRTRMLGSIEEAATTIGDAVKSMAAHKIIVRIGDGAPAYNGAFIALLDAALPPDVVIESVEETGTTRPPRGLSPRRRAKDIYSAIRIARRHGKAVARRQRDA